MDIGSAGRRAIRPSRWRTHPVRLCTTIRSGIDDVTGDIETPMAFMTEVREILADDGIWMFEWSYKQACSQPTSSIRSATSFSNLRPQPDPVDGRTRAPLDSVPACQPSCGRPPRSCAEDQPPLHDAISARQVHCGLTIADIYAIGEMNPDKIGCFTQSSLIPIVSEERLVAKDTDYLPVRPGIFEASLTLPPHS